MPIGGHEGRGNMFLEICKMAIVIAAVLVFVFIAWIDYQTMEIPDWCHLILFGLGCLQIICCESVPLESRGLGFLAISLPMLFANLLRQDSFGGGDIKMCSAAGFLLGAPQVIAGSLIALLLAGVYGFGALLFKMKKPTDSFPLGPFLSIGLIAAMLGGLFSDEI
jgi:prepilin signal peptidase PulO-like enzyme (type II secretory pathway)